MSSTAPWTRQQLVAVAVLAAVGAVALVVAWWGSGQEATLSGQVGWLNLATAGLVVAQCGAGALLLFGRRAIGARRRRLLAHAASAPIEVAVASGVDEWAWVTGTHRAHRPGCQLVRGKPAVVVGPDDIRRRSLLRCEVCGS
jgi:hypothetical protein